jgi:diguanylate cyclase (GGDEF)-like protein/PAS domain S-box-containing protein
MKAVPPPLPAPGLTVDELARAWAAVASRTTYLPMSGEEIEQLLARLIHRLVAAVTDPVVDEQAAIEVAAELVEHFFTGPRSVGRSIEILGDGLPRLAVLQNTAGLQAAVLRVLGAMADGYSDALRQHTFDEQELVNQALLKAKRDAERGRRVSEARFREIFSASAVGIAISDLDGALVDANRAFAALVGRAPKELAGVSLLELLGARDDAGLIEAYRKLTDGELTRFRRRRRVIDADGEVAWTYLVGSPVHDADGLPTHHITIVEDFTELHLLQQELSEQALHDRLTGLPNEHYFMSHLQEVLERADPSALVTVCRVNLDCFSVINDGIGRTTGERLLCSIAGRLQNLVMWERAMVARMGNDDFAILIEDGPRTPELSMLAASINDELSEPVYVGDRGLAVSAGVGVVRRQAGGISPGELIRAADATLHRVKRSGRGQWGLYDMKADAEERDRYRLAAEMPGAHENGEISLEYRPVRQLQGEGLVALQALLRWDRPDGTVVAHAECLALAEETGLVLTIGRWMLHQACTELTRWNGAPNAASLMLRVDLTTLLSQDPDLVAVVNDALAGTGLPAERIQIGVPLTALSHDRGDVLDNVQVLADLGTAVVLLDAAADSGCLTYLEDLPVTAVEMSRPVVDRLAERCGDDSVVVRGARQVIPLVHSVGTTVIVPGLRTSAQVRWWQGAGADGAHGPYFGSPVPSHGVATLLG